MERLDAVQRLFEGLGQNGRLRLLKADLAKLAKDPDLLTAACALLPVFQGLAGVGIAKGVLRTLGHLASGRGGSSLSGLTDVVILATLLVAMQHGNASLCAARNRRA